MPKMPPREIGGARRAWGDAMQPDDGFFESAFVQGWDDRAANMRSDPEALARLSPAVVVPFWRGRPLVTSEGDSEVSAGWIEQSHPVLVHARPERLFLGVHGGIARFAADVSSWVPQGLDPAAMAMFLDATEYRHPALPPTHRFADLRSAMTRMDPADAALAASARAMFNWHRSHRFCAACGEPSAWSEGGWQRQCPACNARHFPRTDPVVIMLVTHGNRALLGRSHGWPEGMYSALAGFVEPGETLEAAVRREVSEETGIEVSEPRYIASQPWPWPGSLMLGFVARAGTLDITLDAELEHALWITREEGAEVLAGLHPRLRAPRKGAIAHHLLHRWVSGAI
jgi:NAD+ diphosphatase